MTGTHEENTPEPKELTPESIIKVADPRLEGLKFVLDTQLTNRECLVFVTLLERELTQAELAVATGLGNSSIHNIVSRLRIKGLLQRKLVVTNDSREYKYSAI